MKSITHKAFKSVSIHFIYLIHGLVFLFICGFSIWLMWHTFGYKDNQFVLASKVWSDFGAHLPLIRSFSLGANIPPEYPHFSGQPINYHFLFYWFAALLEMVGLNPANALNIPSAIGFAALLLAVYVLTYQISRSVLAGILSLLLTLTNPSLSFLMHLSQQPAPRLIFQEIVSSPHFVQFGPWNGDPISAFWNLNIYTNQRHLGASFALVFIFISPLFTLFSKDSFRHRLQLIRILWICFATSSVFIPLLHKAIVPIVAITVFWWGILHKKQRVFIWLFYASSLIFSLPAAKYLSLSNHFSLTYHLGFLSDSAKLTSIFHYWWLNGGIYLPLLFPLIIWGNRSIKTLLLTAMSLLIIANTIQLSPDIINNHKLINIAFICISISFASFLVFLIRSKWYGLLIALVLIGITTISGIQDLFPIVNDSYYYIDDVARRPSSQWILKNTSPKSIFLAADKFYNPASLAGRKLWFGYSYFPWSMGYDMQDRELVSQQIFSSTISLSELCQILKSRGIDYLSIGRGQGEISNVDVQQSVVKLQFTPAFHSLSEGQTIYGVNQNCPNTSI